MNQGPARRTTDFCSGRFRERLGAAVRPIWCIVSAILIVGAIATGAIGNSDQASGSTDLLINGTFEAG